MKTKEKLDALTSDKTSGWQVKAEWREKNEAWLDKSADIAIKVLRELRHQSITQKELAERTNVSAQYINKLLKGQENLSLETICKLEAALGITLVSVPLYCLTMALDDAKKQQNIVLKSYVCIGNYSGRVDLDKVEEWTNESKHPAA
ncbi:helix-turn-helix transcriptional regulator [uncultured Bacteroides sp.]|uniref:helix-turn-helix domain-containing protein n=1 Tax=uncultured Bacteroides sp. TaxID=162156 RepID=UPI002AA77B23|nr:helix-turn-helix transcriptional regulator [uncultured Bacteroides sp.]